MICWGVTFKGFFFKIWKSHFFWNLGTPN
jgi:hypothetical protein